MTPGTLIIFSKNLHHACAQNLYVVLGKVRGSRKGPRQYRIHPISRGNAGRGWKGDKFAAIEASADDLTALDSFGMRIDRLTTIVDERGVETHLLTVKRDTMLAPTAQRQWGKPVGATWDLMAQTDISDPRHFTLVRKATIAGYRASRREAA